MYLLQPLLFREIMKKKYIYIVVILLVTIVLSGCFAKRPGLQDTPAGLLRGIWHGWIAPLALIIEIFNPNIRIYQANNSGFLYDLGFYAAIIAGFGGLSLIRKKK